MTFVQPCLDTSEAVELSSPLGLYLKPVAKLSICVQLPQLSTGGKSISNWEVMEKLRLMIRPDEFILLKVSKSTMEFLRFEAEVETKALMKNLLVRLDKKTIKLSGFSDSLKVRACEAKLNFPVRHDWDSFFRDAKHMNELRPGERPDTIHIQGVPCRWFANRKGCTDKPSESIIERIFSSFGELRCMDVPILDPYRSDINRRTGDGNIKTFTFGQDFLFEMFVQYKEYIGFVKAMTALRGMKLMYKADDGKCFTANIQVDFDKSKHLCDKNIRKRALEQDMMKRLEQDREQKIRLQQEQDEQKREELKRQFETEEEEKRMKEIQRQKKKLRRRREMKRLAREEQVMRHIAMEERKLLIAQRKLEGLRLLGHLFSTLNVAKLKAELQRRMAEIAREKMTEEEKHKELMEKRRQEAQQKEAELMEAERRKQEALKEKEQFLRDKMLTKLNEKKEEAEREALRRKLQSKKLQSVLSQPVVQSSHVHNHKKRSKTKADKKSHHHKKVKVKRVQSTVVVVR